MYSVLPILLTVPVLVLVAYCDLRFMRIPNVLSILLVVLFVGSSLVFPPNDLLMRVSVAAAVFGLGDRGVIEPGRAADVVVFDPDTVAPGPLRRVVDFPADGERLTADAPVGVRHVLVNGVAIRVDGEMVPEAQATRPGVMLR